MRKKLLSWIMVIAILMTTFIAIPINATGLEPKKIYDSEILSNGDIGILYISGSDIYFGMLNPNTNNWSKSKIAEGKDAALALDSYGFPHVAYITTNDNLGYIYYDATSWSTPEIIDSIAFGGVDGALTSPDIVIDSNNKAHISYMDGKGGYTGGNDYSSYDGPDLMYATNMNGNFTKTVRYYGQGWFYNTGWGYNGEYWHPLSPAKIALTNDGYKIGAKHHYFWRDTDPKWSYHSYSYQVFSTDPLDDLTYNLGSSDSGFLLYEMDSNGSTVYSLFNKSGSLYVTSGVTEVAAATKAFTTSGADLYISSNGNINYAAIATNSLLLYQNGEFKEDITLPSSINTAHKLISTVVSANKQYVIYTDTNSSLWVCGVSKASGDTTLSSFEIPDKTPVTISGVTVDNKTYDGTAVSYTGTPTAVISGTINSATISNYTYSWYDVTNSQVLAQAPIDAGSYKFIVAVAETDNTYTGTLEVPFTISKKALTIAGVTATTRNYDSTTNVDITGGSLVGVIDDDTVSPTVPTGGTISNANAGTNKSVTIADITITGADADNYSLTQPTGITVYINKAPLTISSVTASNKPYDELTTAEITAAVFAGLQNSETLSLATDFTASGSFADANAGTNINVSGTISLADTTKANNYSLANGNFTTTANITKAAGLSGTNPADIEMIKNQNRSYSFDLSTIAINKTDAGSITYSLGTLTGGSLFTAVPAIDTDGITLNFTSASLASGTASQVVTISSNNYQDTTATISFVLVDKTPVTISGVTVDNKTYDSTAVSYTGTPTAVNTDAGNPATISNYTYSWYDVTNSQVLAQAPIDAGSYKFIVAVAETDNTYTGTLEVPFTISKKALTIKPRDYSITAGDILPTPELEYLGLISGEDGDSVVNYSTSLIMEIQKNDGSALLNSDTAGDYPIVFTNNPTITSGNYSITKNDSTLVISTPSSGGGGVIVPGIDVITEENNNSTVNKTEVTATNNNGTASANISIEIIDALLDKANKTNATTKNDALEISINSVANTNNLEISILQSQLNKIAKNTDLNFTITSPFISITFDGKALETIADANAGGTVKISTAVIDKSKLSESDRAKVQDRPVYDFTIMNGDKQVSDFAGGHATISIPYTLKAGENPNQVVVYYLADDGSLKQVTGHFDSKTKQVIFRTSHFSKFVIGYNPVIFIDVSANAWYSNAIEFIAAREITSGTSENQYSPNAKLTRGQFVVLLMNAYKIAITDNNNVANFSDAGDAYYTKYLHTAKSMGIINGIGDNMFAPNKEITRQEMFVMLYNALTTIDQLPSLTLNKELSSFDDADKIASWANKAVAALVKANIVSGSNNNINPTASTTRAEIAQVFYNLLSNIK